jgi:hypothetical protein
MARQMVGACGGRATRFLFGAGGAIVIEGAARGGAVALALATEIQRERYMPFERGYWMRSVSAGVLCVGLMALAACSSGPRFLGGKSGASAAASASAPAIGVNGYLWRATLDTLAFMPLASADPYGGVVITDWYTNPEKPDERFKATVYILDSRLRADGLNVAVFKQTRDGSGNWVDAPAASQTETDIENAILTRARQLRLSNIKG